MFVNEYEVSVNELRPGHINGTLPTCEIDRYSVSRRTCSQSCFKVNSVQEDHYRCFV